MDPTLSGRIFYTLFFAFIHTSFGFRARASIRADAQNAHSLCRVDIVESTCLELNSGTHFYRTSFGFNSSIVYVAQLSEHLKVSRASIRAYISALDLESVEETNHSADAYAFSCADLCRKVVEDIPSSRRPPGPDWSCYLPSGSNDLECIDVSPDSLKKLKFHESDHTYAREEQQMQTDEQNSSVDLDALALLDKQHQIEASSEDLRLLIANMFRVFPLLSIEFEDDTHESPESLLQQTDAVPYEREVAACADAVDYGNLHVAAQKYGMKNRLARFLFSQKKEKCMCPPGTVLAGPHQDCAKNSTKLYLFDAAALLGKGCSCRKPDFGARGCQDTGTFCEKSGLQCHLKEIQDRCPVSCAMECAWFTTWKADVVKTHIRAQAFVSHAKRLTEAQAHTHLMSEWFGDASKSTSDKVDSIVTQLSSVLAKVEYRYYPDDDGDGCDGTLAYVLKSRHGSTSPLTQNGRNQFIIHLCPLYMKATESKQITTLIHEASHHVGTRDMQVCETRHFANNYSTDVCWQSYGRKNCKLLAEWKNADAMVNAANYEFFVEDMAEAALNG